MKSEWDIGYIESSYSERLRTFPPATAVAGGISILHNKGDKELASPEHV